MVKMFEENGKTALLFKSQPFSLETSFLKVLKKKLKLEKKCFHFLFWKLKIFDSFKSYKGLTLNVEKS